eukprot:2587003-Rhodomonas_salina.1
MAGPPTWIQKPPCEPSATVLNSKTGDDVPEHTCAAARGVGGGGGGVGGGGRGWGRRGTRKRRRRRMMMMRRREEDMLCVTRAQRTRATAHGGIKANLPPSWAKLYWALGRASLIPPSHIQPDPQTPTHAKSEAPKEGVSETARAEGGSAEGAHHATLAVLVHVIVHKLPRRVVHGQDPEPDVLRPTWTTPSQCCFAGRGAREAGWCHARGQYEKG